jgi:hypothetical protein
VITVTGFLRPPDGHGEQPVIPGLTEYLVLGIRLVVPETQREVALAHVDHYLRECRKQLEGMAEFDLVITAE